MGKNINYGRDENGNMIVLSEEIIPDPAPVLNWYSLKQGLWDSNAFFKVLTGQLTVNAIAFSALAVLLTDGETRGASEAGLLRMFQALGANFSAGDKSEINGLLEANNFTIRID